MKYNLHTHTIRCNHAQGDDREYVESAIKAGIKVLGFSDHCPQFFPNTDYYSNFRMKPEEFEGYVKSIRGLQAEYRDDIEILLGLETEYYPETYGKFMEFITPYKLDYLIMGQHFVGNEYDQNSYYSSRPNRDETLLERYVAQVCEGLRKGVFTYIAHPDILYYEGEPGYYRDKMAELCVCAKELGIPLEYNLLGMTNKKCYPKPEFWKLASEIGNDVLIGYDAHNPEALQNDEAFFNCVLNLNAMGLSPMEFSKINIRNVQKKNR